MEVAIGDLSARKFDGSALSPRHKNLATLCPRLKNCWIHYQTNAPQLPKIGSNCRKSFGKVLMRKSRNCKNCVIHYQTALSAGFYLWKAAGAIIPKISWHRMDPDRGGWIYKKDPSKARVSPTGRTHIYSRICTRFVLSYNLGNVNILANSIRFVNATCHHETNL